MTPYTLPGIEHALIDDIEEAIDAMLERTDTPLPPEVREMLIEDANKIKEQYDKKGWPDQEMANNHKQQDEADMDIAEKAEKITESEPKKEWSLKEHLEELKRKKEASSENDD